VKYFQMFLGKYYTGNICIHEIILTYNGDMIEEVGWLVGWFVVWFVSWLVGLFVSWLVCCMVC